MEWLRYVFLMFEYCHFLSECVKVPKTCRAMQEMEQKGLRLLRASLSLAGSPEVDAQALQTSPFLSSLPNPGEEKNRDRDQSIFLSCFAGFRCNAAGSKEASDMHRRHVYIQPHASPEIGRMRLSCTLVVSPQTSSTLRIEGHSDRLDRPVGTVDTDTELEQ